MLKFREDLKLSGEELDKYWKEHPELLIGEDFDNPVIPTGVPVGTAQAGLEYALSQAREAAYTTEFKQQIGHLEEELRKQLVGVMFEVSSSDMENYTTGIYELHHDGRAWGSRVEHASGYFASLNLAHGDFSLFKIRNFGEGHDEYGIQIYHDDKNNPLDLRLVYPDRS